MDLTTSPLRTDLYQFNMIQAYLEYSETKTAVFEFFVRKLPAQRGFLVAAGLEQALEFLENLRFTPEELKWLESTGRFGAGLLDYLASFRFTGSVHAMREGTVFFANEPIAMRLAKRAGMTATRRPRTEARVRRLGDARGIDKSRPVTEEPICMDRPSSQLLGATEYKFNLTSVSWFPTANRKPRRLEDTIMTTEQKIIRAKVAQGPHHGCQTLD